MDDFRYLWPIVTLWEVPRWKFPYGTCYVHMVVCILLYHIAELSICTYYVVGTYYHQLALKLLCHSLVWLQASNENIPAFGINDIYANFFSPHLSYLIKNETLFITKAYMFLFTYQVEVLLVLSRSIFYPRLLLVSKYVYIK